MQIILLLAGIIWFASILCSQSATFNAASASYQDVSYAVSFATDGDIVTIPSGTATWTSAIIMTHAISIIGSGYSQTIINNSAGMIMEWKGCGTNIFRLSGIRVNSPDQTEKVISLVGPIYKARVDHCYFNKGSCAVSVNWNNRGATGPCYGVVDHCKFYNMSQPCLPTDCRTGEGLCGTTSWQEPILPGSDQMIYYEDNEFIWNADVSNGNCQGSLYGMWGGKACFRYNVSTGWGFYVDAHGDSPDYGTIYFELYNNTFTQGNYGGDQGFLMYQRGGSWVVHDNVIVGASFPIMMCVYWLTDLPEHRVRNTYFWGNSWNGNTDQSSMVSSYKAGGNTTAAYSAANIRVGIEYFLHAPTNGQTFYVYTPLVYPHPLVTYFDGGIAAPTFSIDEGIYYTTTNVTVTTESTNTLFWTTNDWATTGIMIGSTNVAITATRTIKAIASNETYGASSESSAMYAIKCPTPVFTYPDGTYANSLLVLITNALAGCSIYFTTNATTPTTNSFNYVEGGYTVTATRTHKAIAVKDSYEDSAVATAIYTITNMGVIYGPSYATNATVTRLIRTNWPGP